MTLHKTYTQKTTLFTFHQHFFAQKETYKTTTTWTTHTKQLITRSCDKGKKKTKNTKKQT